MSPPRRDSERQHCRHFHNYLSGDTAQAWHLLVADDFHLDAGGGGYPEALLSFFVLCALSGSRSPGQRPSEATRSRGKGSRSCTGITEWRSQLVVQNEWFAKWTREVASNPVVNMDTFEEGLGRIMYVAVAFEYRNHSLLPSTNS